LTKDESGHAPRSMHDDLADDPELEEQERDNATFSMFGDDSGEDARPAAALRPRRLPLRPTPCWPASTARAPSRT
jgi:hypothetical protein